MGDAPITSRDAHGPNMSNSEAMPRGYHTARDDRLLARLRLVWKFS